MGVRDTWGHDGRLRGKGGWGQVRRQGLKTEGCLGYMGASRDEGQWAMNVSFLRYLLLLLARRRCILADISCSDKLRICGGPVIGPPRFNIP